MDCWRARAAAAFAAALVLIAIPTTRALPASAATSATFTGTVHVSAASFSTQTSLRYSLTLANGRALALQPSAGVAARLDEFAEQRVTITGTRHGDDVTVSAVTAASLPQARAAATSRSMHLAVIMVNFSDDQSMPYTASQLNGAVFTNTLSAAGYWNEASNGQESITGNVFGPYTLADQGSSCATAGALDKWMTDAKAKLGAAAADYDHFQVWFPWQNSCGGWSGIGDVNGVRTWIENPPWWTDKYWQWPAHELGHNLGLTHSAAWRCWDGSGVIVPLPANPSGCNSRLDAQTQAHMDYDDPFDVMGDWNLLGRQPSNYHKAELGFITPVVAQNGTFTLAPDERPFTGQTQAIEIPRADGTQLWLEYRQPYGNFDAGLQSNGVLVRVVAPNADPAQVTSHLIDMTPNTASPIDSFDDAALPAGQSWTDPLSNARITVTSVGPNGASVTLGRAPAIAAVDATGKLTVSAGPGVDDSISVAPTAAPNVFTVTDTANRVAPGSGCTTWTVNTVSCGGVGTVTVLGGNGNDTIKVNARALPVTINGGAGNDTLVQLGTGPSLLLGKGGADVLVGGSGVDSFNSGGGNDTILSTDGHAETVKCQAGTDTVDADSTDTLIGCENVTLH